MKIPIRQLSEPFSQDSIKQRKGNYGNILDYLESSTIVQRLNDVLERRWSFTVLEHIIEVEEVIIKGRLQIDDTTREQFGGSSIIRKTDTADIISIADDLKAAASDCLKKCASRITKYLMCPQKYFLQYEARIKWDFTPSNLTLV